MSESTSAFVAASEPCISNVCVSNCQSPCLLRKQGMAHYFVLLKMRLKCARNVEIPWWRKNIFYNMELGGAGSVDYAVRHQNRNDKCYVDNTASWITIQETICPGIIHPSREMSDSIVQETGSSLVNMSCVWLKKVTLQKREPSWLVLCLHNVPLPQGTLLSWGFEIHRVTLNGEYNTTVSAEPWSSSKAFRERKMKTYTIWFKSWMPQQDYTWNLRGERVGDFHSTNLSVPLHCSVFPQLVTINISSSVSTSYFFLIHILQD